MGLCKNWPTKTTPNKNVYREQTNRTERYGPASIVTGWQREMRRRFQQLLGGLDSPSVHLRRQSPSSVGGNDKSVIMLTILCCFPNSPMGLPCKGHKVVLSPWLWPREQPRPPRPSRVATGLAVERLFCQFCFKDHDHVSSWLWIFGVGLMKWLKYNNTKVNIVLAFLVMKSGFLPLADCVQFGLCLFFSLIPIDVCSIASWTAACDFLSTYSFKQVGDKMLCSLQHSC